MKLLAIMGAVSGCLLLATGARAQGTNTGPSAKYIGGGSEAAGGRCFRRIWENFRRMSEHCWRILKRRATNTRRNGRRCWINFRDRRRNSGSRFGCNLNPTASNILRRRLSSARNCGRKSQI